MKHSSSIRGRLLLWLLLPLLVIEAVSSALDYRGSIGPVEAAYDQSLVDTALAISAHLRMSGEQFHLDLSEQSIAMLRADTDDKVYFRVIGPDGTTLGGDADLRVPAGLAGHAFFDGEYLGTQIRGVNYPVAMPEGRATVIVAETVSKRHRARKDLLVNRALEDIGAVIVAALAVWIAIGAVLRPVERLAAQVGSRSPEDLKALPVDDVPREVQPLIESLNRLFGQIAETRDGQRRFIENAAHQLRTPLAGLKGQVDVALSEARMDRSRTEGSGAPDTNSSALPPRLERIREATASVIHLTNQLLTLARSDRFSHDIASRQRVRLPVLIDEVVASFLDAALARGQDLGAETGQVALLAVEWELRELIVNLVDNAVRYTPQNGKVTVRCGVGPGGGPFLEVEDTGPGIAPEERERVFERFYRVSGSASGGSGLGLAIVHEIASLHGGQVSITDVPMGAGAIVRVNFPAVIRLTGMSAAEGA